MSEEITKGLTSKRLKQVGFPKNQDENVDGVIYYKEDSYKAYDKYLTSAFSKASKKLTDKEGTPDFVATHDNKEIIIVIECKEDVSKHQTVDNLDEYKQGLGTKDEISSYCINGALHYATYINTNHDVIAIAVSGTSETNMRVTSFIFPKGGKLSDIKLIENGEYTDTIMNFDDYEKKIDEMLGRHQEESDKLLAELKKYASVCNNYLRANHISAKDRAGFISAIVLALTNENSPLYALTEASLPNESLKKPFNDKINKSAIKLLKESLIDIWDNKDKIPQMKIKSLKEYYDRILVSTLLDSPESNPKYFKYGQNILSSCIFSVYENILLKIKYHTDVDFMGTFYTVFLKYAKGDTKDKGIVLTPKHITELFCDIAEFYLGQKLDETTKVIDICAGTGGTLISALNRMDTNIENLKISEKEIANKKEKVRADCLIGVEREPEMFALAYANMRFHGDGKSNLYSCSSLLKDKGIVRINETTRQKVTLQEELSNMKLKPKVGMINPPYSLLNSKDKKNKTEKQTGQNELDFIYSMLNYLEKGGIGIAIVPLSCASSSNEKKLREEILKEHTLLAVMSMPPKLFKNSDVDATTCIMVFKAHNRHEDSSKIAFLSRWVDDGFLTIPHSGRFDKNGNWLSVKNEWLRQLKGMAKENKTIYLRRELNIGDEWLAEAYVKTDYSKLTEKAFENQLKKYALFQYMQQNDLEE